MTTDLKGIVLKEEKFDKLNIRLGRVIAASLEPSAPKNLINLSLILVSLALRQVWQGSHPIQLKR